MTTHNENWKHYSFPGRKGGPILNSRINEVGGHTSLSSPIVLMLTGDGPKGTKSGTWINLPPFLAESGIRSFLFDFEGLGYSDGDRRTLTLSRAIENLEAAYSFLMGKIDGSAGPIGAIASSFGAAALLASPSIANRMQAIVFKSPTPLLAQAYLNEVGIAEFRRWLDEGYSNMNGYEVSVVTNAFDYNLFASARQITTSCLITHGTADEIVPYAHSELLKGCLGGQVELHAFEGVGHNYSEPGAWDRMAQLYVSWLRNRLM